MSRRLTFIIVTLTAAALFVPWLGECLFSSKGEPREAIVAMSMLRTGDWILPVNFDTDIPYKPPMLAWLIAAFAWLFNGGVVNEYISRLPSALAATGLLVSTWYMVRRHSGNSTAWLTMLICATTFEVMRAAMVCRVDMLLTAFTVGAIYAMATMREHPVRALWAILLLSGAVLTKGPVGSLLPCLATGIYCLLRRDNFWRTLFTLVVVCLASFVLPALWYRAAWLRAGDTFLNLAIEENIGRLTGTMSYESHNNPWYYNIYITLAGLLPWTLPALAAICYRSVRNRLRRSRPGKGWPLLCITAALTIFVFYCIPSSKRSVYLLPCYPFMAYGIATLLELISHTRFMRVWCIVLAVISIATGITFAGVTADWLHIKALTPIHWWLWPMAILPGLYGLWWLCTRSRQAMTLSSAVSLTYVLVLAYNAAFMPMALNGRSDKQAAAAINATVPADARLTGFIDHDRLLRFYSIDFYTADRMHHASEVSAIPTGDYVVTSTAMPSDELLAALGRPAGTRIDTVTNRSADTRRPVYLVHPTMLSPK